MFQHLTQFLGGDATMAVLFLFSVGLLVTSESLQAAFTGYKALYDSEFAAVTPQWSRVAMEAPSNSDGEIYNWLGSVPAMKEWKDSRVVAGLLDHNYTIRNKTWESTIGVKRDTFEDDKLGIINPRVRELAQEAARHPDELVTTLLTANGLCYDGQNFFDTDHSEGDSGAQSNITQTGVTLATVTADFRTARAAMINRKDDRGKPLIKNLGQDATGAGPGLFLVMCPPALQGVFEELMNATMLGGGNTNVLKGAFSLWVNSYLSDTGDWYLFYVGSAVRPLIFQNRVRPEFDQLTNPSMSDRVFMLNEFLYGVRARYNAGYGLWQYAEKVA